MDFLTRVFANADPGHADGGDPSARELLAAGETELRQAVDIDPATRTSLTIAMARAYRGLGDDARQLALMQEVQAQAQAGGSVALRVDALVQLGIAYNNVGNRQEAMKQYLAAEALLQSAGVDDRRRQARIDELVATELTNINRAAEALPRIARAHGVLLETLGAGSQEVTSTLDVYVLMLTEQGRHDEAVAITTPSVEAARTQAMPDARRAIIYGAHALALNYAGRFAEAEPFARQSLALKEVVYGADHPSLGTTLSKLMLILSNEGRLDQALQVGARFLALRRLNSPNPSPTLTSALTSVANVEIRAQRWAQADLLLAEAAASDQALATPRSARSLRTQLLQAQVWLARGDRSRARARLAELRPFLPQLSQDDQALARRLLAESAAVP